MPMSAESLKQKPKSEFEYNGRLFSETGSSNMSSRVESARGNLICDAVAAVLK